jgi:DNA-binding response OmpR family regulator
VSGPPAVLLATRDPGTGEFLAGAMREAGHAVTAVDNGAEAWAAYQQLHSPLVILDVDITRVGGVDVCRRIRAADPRRETFIIACAGPEAQARLASLLDAGADDYLEKPLTPERVHARLAIAARRLSEEAARRLAEVELARARWLAGIGEMTIALQHEINNPLSALISHAELALLDAADRGERDEQIETILEQAQRIAEVVKRIGALRNPMSVEYLPGTPMIDLGVAGGELREPGPATRKHTQ